MIKHKKTILDLIWGISYSNVILFKTKFHNMQIEYTFLTWNHIFILCLSTGKFDYLDLEMCMYAVYFRHRYQLYSETESCLCEMHLIRVRISNVIKCFMFVLFIYLSLLLYVLTVTWKQIHSS